MIQVIPFDEGVKLVVGDATTSSYEVKRQEVFNGGSTLISAGDLAIITSVKNGLVKVRKIEQSDSTLNKQKIAGVVILDRSKLQKKLGQTHTEQYSLDPNTVGSVMVNGSIAVKYDDAAVAPAANGLVYYNTKKFVFTGTEISGDTVSIPDTVMTFTGRVDEDGDKADINITIK